MYIFPSPQSWQDTWKVFASHLLTRVSFLKENMEEPTKKCSKCEEELPMTKTFWYYKKESPEVIRGSICKHCKMTYNRNWHGRNDPGILTAQPHRVYTQPYMFGHKDTEEQVKQAMEVLGMKWSGAFWWKPGYREEDGRFSCIPPGTEETGGHSLTKEETLHIQKEWQVSYFKLEDIEAEFNVTEGKAAKAIIRVYKEPVKLGQYSIEICRYPDGRKRNSIKGQPYRPVMTDEDKEKIVELSLAGVSVKGIAEEMDRSQQAIKYILKKYNDRNEA